MNKPKISHRCASVTLACVGLKKAAKIADTRRIPRPLANAIMRDGGDCEEYLDALYAMVMQTIKERKKD